MSHKGKQYRALRHWARQWKTKPEAMAENLAKLIEKRKSLSQSKRRKAKLITQHLPDSFPASRSKELMTAACELAGVAATPDRLHRLRVYAVRYGLLKYDQRAKLWVKLLD